MKLSWEQIQEKLEDLNGWQLAGNSIQKMFKFEDFVQTVAFVNKLVPVAEEMQHHPDLEVKNYNELTISLTTHDQGGITELDLELARRIDEL